ncbi:hypothetical protein QUB68_28250 [Microcoleus sp. A006_D1]|uniref:hypothetical protein n=1 Tax=Microcoleus sp. A006_D1 TaxID=3055267 RepID=UPI002FD43415
MSRISDCSNNLNGPVGSSVTEILGEESCQTITVGTGSTTLASANTNRRAFKVYVQSVSVPNVEVWIRYGLAATASNAAHPLFNRYLLIEDGSEIRGNVTAICVGGTAQVRVCTSNKN